MQHKIPSGISVDEFKLLPINLGDWVFDERTNERLRIVSLKDYEKVTPGFDYIFGGAVLNRPGSIPGSIILRCYCTDGGRLIRRQMGEYFENEYSPESPEYTVVDSESGKESRHIALDGPIYEAWRDAKERGRLRRERYAELRKLLEEE